MRRKIVAIDFDGTIVEDSWPGIGELRPMAKEVIREIYEKYDTVLWTCRMGKDLEDALEFLRENEIYFHAINENVESVKNDFNPHPKIYFDYLIDNTNIGGIMPWEEVAKILL